MLKLLNSLILIIFIFLVTTEASFSSSKLENKNYFASLRSGKSNIRSGPGKDYPVKFTFKLRGIPVRVIGKYDNWNEIEDFEGQTGWINRNLLTKKRTIIVRTGKVFVKLRAAATKKAKSILHLENNVIADFISCKQGWCKIKVDGKKGWIKRKEIWGSGENS